MDLLQNVLIKVKKSLKNQKLIVTHLSIATPEDPLILLSLSEDDSEDEAVGEMPLGGDDLGDEDDDDDGAADGDEEDKDDEDDEDEDGGDDSEEGDVDEEESDG